MTTEFFKVIATFRNEENAPISGDTYTVYLRDKDRFFDDKLGRSTPDTNGTAEFVINAADILSIDSPGETAPDLYFVVERGGREVFRSEVFPSVSFRETNPVTGRTDALTKAFGPFRVNAD